MEFYLRKLDTLSHQGAEVADCLGKMTNCCQYLGGIGEACLTHGISSPDGGFYILCKGDARNPSLEDPVLAQSWVWRGKTGGLCLDSIEVTLGIRKNLQQRQMVIDLFRILGHLLCQAHNISLVNTGTQSGITRKIGLKGYFTPKEHFTDYVGGYCDSKSQFPLANQSMPYLFYGRTNSSVFQKIIRENTSDFFDTLFNKREALKESRELKQTLAFIIEMKLPELLVLLSQAAEKVSRRDELLALFAVNQAWRKALDNKKVDITLIHQGAYADMLNNKGRSALHLAASKRDQDTFDQLLALHVNLNVQDGYGNTVLLFLLETVLYDLQDVIGATLAQRLVDASLVQSSVTDWPMASP